ncbi:MAG: hypothetical protein QXQ91_03975, partial [Nanopusillaceae archaeon]
MLGGASPGGGFNNKDDAPPPVHPRLETFIAKQFKENPQGVFLSYLVKVASEYFNVEKKALYHRIRRILLSWKQKGLIEIHRVNSLLFARPLRVDLILKLAVFKPDKRVELSDGVSNGSHGSNVKLPVRLHEVR